MKICQRVAQGPKILSLFYVIRFNEKDSRPRLLRIIVHKVFSLKHVSSVRDLMSKQSIISNIIKYSFSSFSSIFMLVLLIVAGRKLGANDFGVFSYALAFTFLLEPMLDPGLYHYLIRDIARNLESTSKYISHALTYKMVMAPLYFVTCWAVAFSLNHPEKTIQVVHLIGVATILKSAKDVFRSAIISHEKFGIDAWCLAIERISLLAVGSWMLICGKGLIGLCWAFVLVRVCDLALTGFITRTWITKFRLGSDVKFIFGLVAAAVPIGAFYVTLNVYNYIDTVMLSWIRGDIEVGWYSASYRIYEGLLVLPVIISTVLLPRLSSLFTKDMNLFSELMNRGFKYVFVMSLLVIGNGIILSGNIILLLYGEEYRQSVVALNILLFGIAVVFPINYLQTVMIAVDKQKMIFVFAIIGLIANVIMNIFLIQKYGFVGAALATVAAEALVFCLLIKITSNYQARRFWWKAFMKPLIAALIPLAIIEAAMFTNHPLAKAIVFNIAFVILLAALRFFDDDERRFLGDLAASMRLQRKIG